MNTSGYICTLIGYLAYAPDSLQITNNAGFDVNFWFHHAKILHPVKCVNVIEPEVKNVDSLAVSKRKMQGRGLS